MKTFYRLSPWILQTFIWPPTRLILKFFSHFEVMGLENIKSLPRGVIFAINHSSELDPILLPASLPFLHHLSPIFYTSREKSFYVKSGWRQIFYGGFIFKIWGAHPVLTGIHNYELSLKTHAEIVRNGGSVLIFPEGKRTIDGSIKPAKGGVTYLSYITKAPIVPVAIDGAFRTLPKDFLLRRRAIQVTFGKPISVEELFPVGKKIEFGGTGDTFIEAAQSVMESVRALKHLPVELSPIQSASFNEVKATLRS